jgi:hypothetical protein
VNYRAKTVLSHGQIRRRPLATLNRRALASQYRAHSRVIDPQRKWRPPRGRHCICAVTDIGAPVQYGARVGAIATFGIACLTRS